MRTLRIATFSNHASRQLARRNLNWEDVHYVIQHGRTLHSGKALFIHLGKRDIPEDDLRDSAIQRLEGTVLVLDPNTGAHLTTAYRNRRRGIKDIKHKSKRALSPDLWD
jgi:hypothetical protein